MLMNEGCNLHGFDLGVVDPQAYIYKVFTTAPHKCDCVILVELLWFCSVIIIEFVINHKVYALLDIFEKRVSTRSS